MARGVDLGAPDASTVLSRSVWASLLTATGTGFQLLGALAICSYLHSRGETLWSFLAVPLLTLGHMAWAVHDGWGLILAPRRSFPLIQRNAAVLSDPPVASTRARLH